MEVASLILISAIVTVLAIYLLEKYKPGVPAESRQDNDEDCFTIQPNLVVILYHVDDQVVCNIDGPYDDGDVAFAAAFLTGIAAQNCPDGFEKGLEWIQEDAVNMVMAENRDARHGMQ